MSKRERAVFRVTVWGAVVNVVLVGLKLVAGVAGRSSAMVADAVHSLSDLATDVVVIVFVHLSSRPSDESHDYGHGKYETLATAVIGLALLAVGVGIFWSGAVKVAGVLRGEVLPAPEGVALVAAVVSVVAKEWLFRWTAAVGRRVESGAVVANAWHHRSDALSSIGTAAGVGGAMFLGPGWRVLDPLAAVVVSVFIGRVAVRLLVPCLNDLLERSLPGEVEREILATVREDGRVHDPHNLRTRRIGNAIAIEVHIRVNPGLTVGEGHEVATGVERRLRARYGERTHVAVHVEPDKLDENGKEV